MQRLGFTPSSRAVLAVSGGGDSVALTLLFAAWARREGAGFADVLIVDHGLRADSRKEAEQVTDWARSLGFESHLLSWLGAKPKTGLEEKARAARYRLMGEWCIAHSVPALFVAHTREDQAETFLLRLGRGSGVDGLSAMRPRAPLPLAGFGSLELLRPLLDVGRDELRAYALARGASWLEDPMNQDPQFARVRIRKALPALEAAGLGIERIAEAARHLARARYALEHATEAFLAGYARFGADGVALVDGAALLKLPRETGLRALSSVLMRVGGAAYRPRFQRLEALFDSILEGCPGRTLCACAVARAVKAQAVFGPSTLLVRREGSRRSVSGKQKNTERQLQEYPPQKGVFPGIA